MSGAADRAERIARLQAWAADAGARFDALEFPVDAAGDCSALARRDIAAGEVVIAVPRRLMLVERDARDTVATWLALEVRRETSRWRPFLDVMPTELPDVAIFRSDEDIEALAGTAAHTLATGARRSVAADHAALPDELRAEVSLAAYGWARAIIESRGFSAPHSMNREITFIPIIDLMNHQPGDTAWRFDRGAAMLEVVALRAFAAGDPVGFTYGEFSNAELLVWYGFALPDNPDDEAALSLAGAEPALVTGRLDQRFRSAFELAGSVDAMAAAARSSLERLDQHAPTGDSAWHRACALVRRGERAVLEKIIALTSEPGTLDALCDSARS